MSASINKRKRFSYTLFLVICLLLCTAFCIWIADKSAVDIPQHRLQWWLDDIDWDENRREYSGKGVRVAIIDTKIDFAHPDIENCFEKQIFTFSYTNKNANDIEKHGTAVAGIISAYPAKKNGVLGVAPNAKIISICVAKTDEESIEATDLVKAIECAINQDVNIINISCGLKAYSSSLEKAILKAYKHGIIIVASAGNFMSDDILYPAKFDTVLAVGAKNKAGDIISPKGKLTKNVVFLPGESIVSVAPNGLYTSMFGTSASTAIMSGIVAIMLEANPQIKNNEIYEYFNGLNVKNKISVNNCIKLNNNER